MGLFSLKLAEWAEKTKSDLDKVMRTALLDLDGKLLQKSPAGDAKYWKHPPPPGYVGGRFRANWQLTAVSPAAGVIDAIDTTKDGEVTRGAHAAIISSAKSGPTYYLVNNLPYAQRIENGWSRQAPIGVVALAVLSWQTIVDRAITQVRTTSAEDFAQGWESYKL